MSKPKKKLPKKYREKKSTQKKVVSSQLQVSEQEVKCPTWKIHNIDLEGPFGWHKVSKDEVISNVLPKMKHYESMTWGEIQRNKKRNHASSISNFSREAQKRLAELRMDDIEELFAFRLSGKQRIWGQITGNIFSILWWDPEHEVYPSLKD